MSKRRTQAERRAQTRAALIEAARALFTERGYAAVSLEEIVRAAGVTRGALYHHFEDKQDLFRAIIEEIEAEIDQQVMAADSEDLPVPKRLQAALDAFLEACLRPDVLRILLLDGPSVLGWQAWREIDAGHALLQIDEGLAALVAGGWIPVQPTRPLAHLIYGATIEAALYVAAAPDPQLAMDEMRASLKRFLFACLSGDSDRSR